MSVKSGPDRKKKEKENPNKRKFDTTKAFLGGGPCHDMGRAFFSIWPPLICGVNLDPCPDGLLEIQKSEAAFEVRPVQAKCILFLASQVWQARGASLNVKGWVAHIFILKIKAPPNQSQCNAKRNQLGLATCRLRPTRVQITTIRLLEQHRQMKGSPSTPTKEKPPYAHPQSSDIQSHFL